MEAPTLYLICGMVGAGKTTLAKAMETHTGAIRLCPDEWLVDLVGDKRDRENLDRFRTPVETIQWSLARRLLSHGLSVVLENGFWRRDERIRIAVEARALPCRVELHYLDVPRPMLEARIERRNVSGGEADIPVAVAELDEWLTWFEPPDADESAHYDRFEVHTP